ncbi:hypothetical protein CHUAL_007997 [Chamberlinius hualienensis]
MDDNLRTLPPGDPKLIESIVSHLKCEGIFDEFRKACLADVDTKPAYQNLRTRVEGFADDYLKNTQWRPDLNKNQLRDGLRRHIQESGLLTSGVERIIDQIVNPKIVPFFLPKIVEIVCRLLGIVEEETSVSTSLAEDIKTGLESSAATGGTSELITTTETVKTKPNSTLPVAGKLKISPTPSLVKPLDSSKPQKITDDKSSIKIFSSQDSVSPKIKFNESPKPSDAKNSVHSNKPFSTDEKKTLKSYLKDESDKVKTDKPKPIDKTKQKVAKFNEDAKTKLGEKAKSSEKADSKSKTVEKPTNTEGGDKSKIKESVSSKDRSPSTSRVNKTNETGDGDKVSSSQPNKSPGSKDAKKESIKLRTDERTQSPKNVSKSKSSSKKLEVKSGDKKTTKEKSESSRKEKTKRKLDDEGSQDKNSKFEIPPDSTSLSPSYQEKATKEDDKVEEGEMSDVTVSSVHTSDLSDFDDRISLSDVDDEESNSQKTSTKSPRKDKQTNEQKPETSEEKRAGLKISEDALMSSDELRVTSVSGEVDHSQSAPRRELRRQRKANPKYTSEDFSTIFSNNQGRHSPHGDMKLTSQNTDSANKPDLLGSPISDASSENEEISKQSISTFHSPILSSDDDLSSNSRHDSQDEQNNPKETGKKCSAPKMRPRIDSSPDGNTSSPQISQDSGSGHSKKQKLDSRQRYDSTDLYKPRPVIVNSRRRAHNTGSDDNSPARSSPRQSSSETGSPGQFEHLPPSKRRRV